MTSAVSENQIPLIPEAEYVKEQLWFGLRTDHRRLFDALQDGWLRPFPSGAGIALGVAAYAFDLDIATEGHRIEVHLKVDPERLPELDVETFRGGHWTTQSVRAIDSSYNVIYWPGAIPTFAIPEISVSTHEQRVRLVGMTRLVSNVSLTEEAVTIEESPKRSVSTAVPAKTDAKLVVPEVEGAIHGSISMAVWAVPRIDPWLDLLMASLVSDRTRLPELADAVMAPWCRYLPWVSGDEVEPEPTDTQSWLWRAAITTFAHLSKGERLARSQLADRIAEAWLTSPCSETSDRVRGWLHATQRILRGDSTIVLDGWQYRPVETAIQLVLNRPEPLKFKTWFQDLPELPPAIAWSAAALCGLLHGYRRLDNYFRGEARQRELLSILALRACTDAAHQVVWPSLDSGGPEWRRDAGCFILSWGPTEFAQRPEKARGKWYAANLDDPKTACEARALATKLKWQCAKRDLVLKDASLLASGPGTVNAAGEPGRRIEVSGEVRLRLPPDVRIEESLDANAFRRLVAVEGGRLPRPPAANAPALQLEDLAVPGLRYVPGFITEREEDELISIIDRSEWRADIKRRVQHYGWRYDYKARKVDPSMFLGRLPDWAEEIARRLVASRLVPQLPDQVIVNEYVKTQGIHTHIDAGSFADGIATISLLESWEMVFREKSTKRKIGQVLERRSLAIMSGDARYRWTHEIPKRKTEAGRMERGRRISLTFRKVVVPPDMESADR